MANKRVIGGDNQEQQVEVFGDQEVEPVLNLEMGNADRTISEEAFMNELVEIEIAETTDENQPPHVLLNVNGVSMPILRGQPVRVKRKYVEVLARCKETKYKQPTRDMGNPEAGNQLIGATALTYPFQVLADSPKGTAWLRAVRAEAA